MFHSRKSSRNHNLDEFCYDDENSEKQQIRVTPKTNLQSMNSDRASKSMRHLKSSQGKQQKKPPTGSLLTGSLIKNRTVNYDSAAQYTETMQSVPCEAYPYQGSDPGQTPTKLSQTSNFDHYANSVHSKLGFTSTIQRMTSADKVKVSTPMSYKTKQSLDSISAKTLNSQKSTRRMQIPSYSVEGDGSSRQSEISMSATGTGASSTKDKKPGVKILAQKNNKNGKSLGWRYLSNVIKK